MCFCEFVNVIFVIYGVDIFQMVCVVDLWKLGQICLGDMIRFVMIDFIDSEYLFFC